MKAFVVGFPKSGTTTIQTAFVEAGLNSWHWQAPTGQYVGELLYKNHFRHGDPFSKLGHVDAITQADVCIPAASLNLWPQLDFAFLARVRELHPDCLMVLNFRDPKATASSISRWGDMQMRFLKSDIIGLPRGYGSLPEIEAWIRRHHDALRHFFAGDRRFVEIDIAEDSARAKLSDALGVRLPWWGIANANPDEARKKLAGR